MSRTRILIIDDDPDFVDATKAILETGQYEVSCAYNEDEGLQSLEEEIPDLIILDIMMRRFAEGFTFARGIRKDPRYQKIPIIVATSVREQTGFDFPGEPKHPKFFPIDEFMEKPLEPQLLLETIERLLAKRDDDPA
jgi:CheY-like chemotaxis protein